jgi:Matrixin
MMEMNTGPSDVPAMIAQAAPSATAVKQPNWMSNLYKKGSDLQSYSQSINSGETTLASFQTKYLEKGPLGMPSLVISSLVLDFSAGGSKNHNRQLLELAGTACYILDVKARQAGAWGPECKIEKFITMPKGKLTEFKGPTADSNIRNYGPGTYYFDPKGFGRDTIRFILTNGEGKKVDVTYRIKMVPAPNDYGQADQGYEFARNDAVDSSDLASRQESRDLMNILADASQAFTGFSDLAGTAVGQATGTNITLDTNAAGHGWFVDTTPDDNSEFLATSNPNVWIARSGSAADGKMDMLSVLLHEYGHVLGLDHSADNGDAMSPVLQPGVRKLWSETDLAKLNEIIALQSTPFGQLPADYPVDYPSNGLPPGQTRASTPVARRPRRSPTDVNIDLLSDAKIEALNAINPTLTGGDLLSPQGWETTGAVNIANGHATLAETARSQSRLTQGFVLSSQDRYLSFTVEGLQMTDSTVGPDDAFEVALLNSLLS